MLVVNRVYNNNTVLVDVGRKDQAIIQGKGVGFQRRHGDDVPPNQVERIFYLNTSEAKERFGALLKDVPIDITMTSFAIIEMAKKRLSLPRSRLYLRNINRSYSTDLQTFNGR